MDRRDKKCLCCGSMSVASRNPGSLVTSVSISGIQHQQQLGGCFGGSTAGQVGVGVGADIICPLSGPDIADK